MALTTAWGLSREPFAQDVPVKELFPLPGLAPFIDRFDYAIANGLSTVITGEVGSGKSTSLRAAAERLHPSQYRVISLIATSGSLMELLRQVCIALGDPPMSNSIAKMVALVRALLLDIASKKQIPVLLIDEAHLLRLDVFDQLHTVAQADFDSRTLVPIVLSGQINLIDKLLFHTSKPFASRIVGWSHMEALQREHMADYLAHHVSIAGATKRSSLRMSSPPSTRAPAACFDEPGISPAALSWRRLSKIAPSPPPSTSVSRRRRLCRRMPRRPTFRRTPGLRPKVRRMCVSGMRATIGQINVRGDTNPTFTRADPPVFQSTRPRGARRGRRGGRGHRSHVSIHAPARGATLGAQALPLARLVSIHAPARGATRG